MNDELQNITSPLVHDEFGLSPLDLKVLEVLCPYTIEEMRRMRDNKIQLAHYCSASTAIKIIGNQEIWLRNCSEMNDFEEIQYGLNSLSFAWDSCIEKFSKVFEGKFPKITEQLVEQFNLLVPKLRYSSFICCLSRHNSSEDEIGRLSMWRAYGSNSGVAIITDNAPFLTANNEFGAFSGPVEYLTKEELCSRLQVTIDNCEAHCGALDLFGSEYIISAF